MTKYSITNPASGVFLGVYEASSSEEALDMLAKDAGYHGWAAACDVVGGSSDEMIVTPVSAT